MLLHSIDLTTALRPSLLPDETLLFVQDAVGLYHGSLKIPEYQHGQVYLTSHRACYVDEGNARQKAVAVSLKDVERCELYAGFLKSSAKVTIHPKAAKQFGLAQMTLQANATRTEAASNPSGTGVPSASNPPTRNGNNDNATWICTICSFSNPVPKGFDPTTANAHTLLPACLTCGMRPALMDVVKGALAGVASTARPVQAPQAGEAASPPDGQGEVSRGGPRPKLLCPRCTFFNHPSMTSCEICGAALPHSQPSPATARRPGLSRTESPGPSTAGPSLGSNANESLKFSFRAGGEKIFLERLRWALVQRKWMSQNAPSPQSYGGAGGDAASPAQARAADSAPPPPAPSRNIGITGLERRDKELRKNNEVVIGNAFADLSALMASAKEIIALAERFSSQTKPALGSSPSASAAGADGADPVTLLSALNLTTTRDMLGSSASNSTYLSQLSRQLAEFLTDDTSGTALLRASGGIVSLVDLWASFNRARGGVELVSPTDFADAVNLFEKLKLPVQVRSMRSGLRVVRGSEWSDERIAQAVVRWLRDLRAAATASELASVGGGEVDPVAQWGRGVTALETAERFGWSVGVASEELTMVEERGLLCREVGLEGVKFWENWFVHDMAIRE